MRALLLRRRVQSVTFLVPVSVPCYPRRCAAEHRLEPLGEVHRLQAPRGTHCEHRRRDIPAVAAPMLQGPRGRVHREACTGGRTAALCRRQGAHRGVDGLECRIGERSAAQHGSQQQPQHQQQPPQQQPPQTVLAAVTQQPVRPLAPPQPLPPAMSSSAAFCVGPPATPFGGNGGQSFVPPPPPQQPPQPSQGDAVSPPAAAFPARAFALVDLESGGIDV